jgi:SAM-dependent methyltransferase
MLRPGLKRAAARALPRAVRVRLDPVEALIEEEVMRAAAGTGARDVVLDAGAGEGRHRPLFTAGRYVALDAGFGDPSWDYSGLDVLGRLEQVPLRSGVVDRILCMVVLEHTRDPRRVLEEFARVLKSGGELHLVVPFLWEEHQKPHDYFRFTRHGVELLLEGLPFEVELLEPIGGFFRVCARRCVNALGFLQGGWRWPLFVLAAPFLGLLLPLLLHHADGLDRSRHFSLGFLVRARRRADTSSASPGLP